MLSQAFCVFSLLLAAQSFCDAALISPVISAAKLVSDKALKNDVLNKTVIDKVLRNSSYYDPDTGLDLKGVLQKSSKSPLGELVFQGLNCDCQDLGCVCCAGLNLPLLKGDQKLCTQIGFQPEDLTLKAAVNYNNKQIIASSLSGSNPKPLCVPLPYVSSVTICVRVYDLGIVGKNLRGCVDLETQVIQSPVLVLHFNCLSLGLDGVSLSRPGSSDSINLLPGVGGSTQNILQEIYDQVNFEPEDQENQANSSSDSSDSSSSSDEDDQIGQLKL